MAAPLPDGLLNAAIIRGAPGESHVGRPDVHGGLLWDTLAPEVVQMRGTRCFPAGKIVGKEYPQMIELTTEQQQIVDVEGGHVDVIDPRTKASYVLVRKEVYDRLRGPLEDDSSAEDAFQAQIEAAAAAGREERALDVYNELDSRNQP